MAEEARATQAVVIPVPVGQEAAAQLAAMEGGGAPQDAADVVIVRSPMVGTFYGASAPDQPPYVNSGQQIKEGDVLCIVEAMKLMNEIKSEMGGTILEILVSNGQPVEYDQPLFKIKKG